MRYLGCQVGKKYQPKHAQNAAEDMAQMVRLPARALIGGKEGPSCGPSAREPRSLPARMYSCSASLHPVISSGRFRNQTEKITAHTTPTLPKIRNASRQPSYPANRPSTSGATSPPNQ